MKPPSVQTQLTFNGRCEEALKFYTTRLGAKVDMLKHYSECPDPMPAGMLPGFENKVMHAEFHIGETAMMATDGMGEGPAFASF